MNETPPHYDKPVTPWDLEKCMETSGNAFVDSRRTDAIEYCFRLKGDLLGDLKKARHCLDSAIEVLAEQVGREEVEIGPCGRPELCILEGEQRPCTACPNVVRGQLPIIPPSNDFDTRTAVTRR